MFRVKMFLLVVMVLSSSACAGNPRPSQLASQTAPPSSTATPVPSLVPSESATPTLEPTSPQIPSETPSPIASTSTIDPASATMVAMLGSMGNLMNIWLYINPVGTPLQSWNGVPIMAQATSGQEFNAGVYSYVAAATLDHARQFYNGKAGALGLVNAPSTGSGGSGSTAEHDVTYFSYNLTIVLISFDENPNQVIVEIARIP